MTKLIKIAAALAFLVTAPGVAYADGDAAKGKKLMSRCKACHSYKTMKKKVGPSIKGVVGRKAASVEGYKYSKGLKAAGAKGLVWDEKSLMGYIENPKKWLAGYLGKKMSNKMTYRLKKEKHRKDVIAFLKTLSK